VSLGAKPNLANLGILRLLKIIEATPKKYNAFKQKFSSGLK
jgi:hypothetical protein